MEQIKIIGVCLSTLHEEDRFNFVKELNKYAVPNNYRLLVFNSCADLYEQSRATNEGSSAVYKLIPYDKLAAVIIFPNIMYNTEMIDEIITTCNEKEIPVISLDKVTEGCYSFLFNNSEIFEELCRHVIEDHGARKIYMMAGFKDNVYSEERIEAFRRALERNNIPFEQDNVGYGCFWEQPTLDIMKKWFIEDKREIPDAIICANDFMAITTSAFLQRLGVRIPEDCIVTGFDGIKQTEYLPPKITMCKQDFDKMGSLIIDVLNKILNGEEVERSYFVDFNIIKSQSCGCKKVTYDNVGHSIQALINSLRLSDERQKMITNTQASIPNIADINYIPRILMNKFRFNTCVFALNEMIFSPPDFGNAYRGKYCFSENINVIFHRYDKIEYEQCKIPLERLLPRYDLITEQTNPTIVCCANFTDLVMGYCVFQVDIDIDEYEKIHTIMGTIGAVLGNFHSRIQIKSINYELQKISQRDFMTGLFNRRGFYDNMEKILNDAKYIGSNMVIISADLDELKYINDTFGHNEGDNAITTVGKALISSSLHNEICARFGGDEFCAALIIPDNNAVEAFESFKSRFIYFLSDYNLRSDKPYKVKASIGYSCCMIGPDFDIDKMIDLADEQMYIYKAAHKVKR